MQNASCKRGVDVSGAIPNSFYEAPTLSTRSVYYSYYYYFFFQFPLFTIICIFNCQKHNFYTKYFLKNLFYNVLFLYLIKIILRNLCQSYVIFAFFFFAYAFFYLSSLLFFVKRFCIIWYLLVLLDCFYFFNEVVCFFMYFDKRTFTFLRIYFLNCF